MKNIILFAIIVAGSLFGTFCRDNSQGELIKESSKKYVNEILDHKTDLQKKRIALDGYIYPKDTTDLSGGTATVIIGTQPGGKGDTLADIEVGTGGGKNEVVIPTKGKGKDVLYKTTQYEIDESGLKFFDSDGNQHPITDKVRLSGTVKYVNHFQGGFSHLPDPMNRGKEIYPFVLQDVRIDPVK